MRIVVDVPDSTKAMSITIVHEQDDGNFLLVTRNIQPDNGMPVKIGGEENA